MFSGTKHIWFSHLSFLSSLVLLSVLVIAHYNFITETAVESKLELIQNSLFYLFAGLIVFLAVSSAFLKNSLSAKPFIISLILIILLTNLINLNLRPETFGKFIFATYAKSLIYLAMLAAIWSIRSITKPKKYSLNELSENKYLIWAWLGFLLFAFQASINAIAAVNNAEFLCADLGHCFNTLKSGFSLKAIFVAPLDTVGLAKLEAISEISSIIALTYLTLLSMFLLLNRQLSTLGFFLLTLAGFVLITEIIRPNFINSIWFILSYDAISISILFVLISLLTHLHRPPADSFR